MKLFIIRHGQTDWNKKGIIQGRTDIPLNEEGKKQALETKEKLNAIPLDCIFCSPLTRTKQTAEIINQERHLPILSDDRLLERDFGGYEGSYVKDLNFREFWKFDTLHSRNGEETAVSFFTRVQDFVDDILKKEYNNVLIVAHGGVSLPIYAYFRELKEENDYFRYMLKNCEVACYDTETDKDRCAIS